MPDSVRGGQTNRGDGRYIVPRDRRGRRAPGRAGRSEPPSACPRCSAPVAGAACSGLRRSHHRRDRRWACGRARDHALAPGDAGPLRGRPVRPRSPRDSSPLVPPDRRTHDARSNGRTHGARRRGDDWQRHVRGGSAGAYGRAPPRPSGGRRCSCAPDGVAHDGARPRLCRGGLGLVVGQGRGAQRRARPKAHRSTGHPDPAAPRHRSGLGTGRRRSSSGRPRSVRPRPGARTRATTAALSRLVTTEP